MKNIGIVGWNGKMNAGDDAMTMVIVNHLYNKYGPETVIKFLADKDSLAEYSADQSVNVSGFSGYNLASAIPGLRKLLLGYWYPGKFVENKDLLLFGGGSLFHSSGTLQKHDKVLRAFRKTNPTGTAGALGVSIGPFKDSRTEKEAKEVIGSFDFIVVRDQRSFDLLQKWNLSLRTALAPDLAILAPQTMDLARPSNPKQSDLIVGISLRHGHTNSKREDQIINALKILDRSNGIKKIKLFTFCELPHDNDSISNNQLLKKMPAVLSSKSVEIHYSNKPTVFYQEIQSCDFTLCMRLHSAIFSYATKTPFLTIPYHQKCIDFCKDIARIDEDLLVYEDTSIAKLEQNIEWVLNHADDMFENQEEVIALANKNFSFLP